MVFAVRNWEEVFQGGQFFTPQVIRMLKELEAEIASITTGGVQSVAATDGSIVVSGTADDPTVATGTLDAVAAAHPPVADVALNSQKITGLAAGVDPTDAVNVSQLGGGGSTVTVNQTGHGLAVGDAIRFDGADYVKALADSAADAEVVGVVSAVPGADDFTFTLVGPVTGLSGLTAPNVYFLDPATPGALTDTPPATTGQVSKPLLVATAADEGLVFNWRGEVIGSGGSQPGAARWVGPYKINAFAGQQFEDQVAGTVAGGTYTVTYGIDESGPLDWNGSAADLKAALEGMPLIGAGNVVSVVGTDVNGGYVIQFTGLAMTALLTADSTNLTGPDAPYNVGGLGYTSIRPLVTLAADDVLDALAWTFATDTDAWDAGATLEFSDDPASSNGDVPEWAPSFTYGPIALDGGADAMTNFRPLLDPSAAMPTLDEQMIGKWISDTSLSRSYLPIFATGPVTIYATTNPPAVATNGEVWIWVRRATPEAP